MKNITFVKMSQSNCLCFVAFSGAAIHKFLIKNTYGEFQNVALPLELSLYGGDASMAGATIGPVAGRVKYGILNIEGREFDLEKNEGENHIHGGTKGLECSAFEPVDFHESEDGSYLTLKCVLGDGVCGFPGNREFYVTYILKGRKDQVSLRIEYDAVSDKDTYIDMTNHTYWNLNGFPDDYPRIDEGSGSRAGFLSGTQQHLMINADRVIYNDHEHLPQRICPVKGTAFDFIRPVLIRDRIDEYPDDPQLKNALGYNNAFILRNSGSLSPSAALLSGDKSLKMEMYTDQPSVVLYSGGYLDFPSAGIALEAQNIPDAQRFMPECFNILKSGEHFYRFIEYRFFNATGNGS